MIWENSSSNIKYLILYFSRKKKYEVKSAGEPS